MKQIIVAQRGWVVVGDVKSEGDELVIENASVIRRWGTSNGLPQLANEGPLENTVLDKSDYPIRIHPLSVVMKLDVNPEKWN